VIDPGGNLFRAPIPAGGAVLNGAGECTGFIAMQELGRAGKRRSSSPRRCRSAAYTTPPANCWPTMIPGSATDDVIIPGCRRMRRQLLERRPPDAGTRDDVVVALRAARASAAASAAGSASAPGEGAIGTVRA